MTTSPEREIGRLQAQVEALQNQQTDMNRKLDTLVDFMSSARGSWKALLAMGSLASAVTVAIIKLWSLVSR